MDNFLIVFGLGWFTVGLLVGVFGAVLISGRAIAIEKHKAKERREKCKPVKTEWNIDVPL